MNLVVRRQKSQALVVDSAVEPVTHAEGATEVAYEEGAS
jgi:hypothetical protein